MSLILSGSDGVSDIDGSAATPAVRGTDSNTGIFFPAADTIAFSEGGAEAMRITSSGNVGIATTSPTSGLEVYRATSTTGSLTDASLMLSTTATTGRKVSIGFGLGGGVANTCAANIGYDVTNGAGAGLGDIYFSTRNTTADSTPTERMRIDSSGNLLFNSGYGSVATAYGCRAWVNFNGTGTPSITGSANVSSITDNGTGDFTVNFTTAMPDANYAITSSAFENVGFWAGGVFGSRSSFPPTTTAVRGSCVSYVGNYVDPNIVNVSIFR